MATKKKRGRPKGRTLGCLHCYSFHYKPPPRRKAVPRTYPNLCWECYTDLKENNKQYLDVYDSWRVNKKDWDIDRIETIRTIKEQILFGKLFSNLLIE